MPYISKKSFIEKYAASLNAVQIEAMETVDGPVLLLAVPGSGKTTTLVTRIGYMIYTHDILPENILTLTYTVAATKDMAARFASIFGGRPDSPGCTGSEFSIHDHIASDDHAAAGSLPDYADRVEFRTINGICAKIIQRYAYLREKPAFELLPDDKAIARILSEILASELKDFPTESDIKQARMLITYCKNMLLTDPEIEKEGRKAGIPLLPIFRKYNQYLLDRRLMDYDDQMVYACKILKAYPELLADYRRHYPYILVDEAQDTSKIQHLIISLLAGPCGNLFMVGDEDQSIYGFRAAYPQALLAFEEEHPGARILVMDRNYRSNAKIVAAANRFIQHNKARHEKHMAAVRDAGSEIQFIPLRSRTYQYSYLKKVAQDCRWRSLEQSRTAVLYRDNECALPLIDLLERGGIPYTLKGGDTTFFTSRVFLDVTGILNLARDPYDTDTFLRVYSKCQTYLKKAQAEELCRISRTRKIPVADAANYLPALGGNVLGRCRALSTNLRSMVHESPSKALFRIETLLGYGEYLEKHGLDTGKLFVLKALANQETTLDSFLARLASLPQLMKKKAAGMSDSAETGSSASVSDSARSISNYARNTSGSGTYNSFLGNFCLSTIHSAKGLEYDRVYLMDVCDSVFPNCPVPKASDKDPQTAAQFEEERRLFYVGMTRARNELCIFRFEDEDSCFVKELTGKNTANQVVSETSRSAANARLRASAAAVPPDYSPHTGDRVVQRSEGVGTIRQVSKDKSDKVRFQVAFDSGMIKWYQFPEAFQTNMRLK